MLVLSFRNPTLFDAMDLPRVSERIMDNEDNELGRIST
jgi:hypothetical protein